MSEKSEQERRTTFRVAVRSSSGLQASFVIDGTMHMARAGNLSAEGIFIRPLDRRTAPKLSRKDTVVVEIEFEGENVWLSGVVRSHRDGGYGIHFPIADENGYRNPRDVLARIAMEMQRESITQRIQVIKLPEEDVK